MLLRFIGITFLIAAALPVVLFLLLIFPDFKTRSVSLPVDEKTELKFAVVWNMGMDQYIGLYRNGNKIAEEYEQVFEKPYWSGGPVFVSRDRSVYFVVLRMGAYKISVEDNKITNNCELSSAAIASLDYLGKFSVVMPSKYIPGQHESSRGEDVRFTPAWQVPPDESGEIARKLGFKDLCG